MSIENFFNGWATITNAEIPADYTISAEIKHLLSNATANIALENVKVKTEDPREEAKKLALVGASLSVVLGAVVKLEGRVIDLETRLAALETPQQGT
ncbi:hypothetical protein Srot_0026 [Segniliparus rotundus DSM 44985]|uniref:Uncharacterized protein n=1 Tax=Segniliparus rotundus (strain ATCC BAA-972 / CDC 1076 / CIP 108378 / DSM 44985 / JCM 13578) TaxID=640132 RepID=D6Z9J2_SEGRD|nr:hypothetical protein [Segniliparus rotundus]ADG96519.1 hypothetical protein Srot_0026 [Segniliparus rotundus DSM 44985]